MRRATKIQREPRCTGRELEPLDPQPPPIEREYDAEEGSEPST